MSEAMKEFYSSNAYYSNVLDSAPRPTAWYPKQRPPITTSVPPKLPEPWTPPQYVFPQVEIEK
jgi:hypothetical protein